MINRPIATLVGVALALTPLAAGAQAAPTGMMTWEMSGKTPAVLAEQAPMAAGVSPTVRITIGSDGKRFAAQMGISVEPAPSPELAMISAAKLLAVWGIDADSIQIGVELPEPIRDAIAAMIAPESAGTPPTGYRVTLKLPDVEDAVKDNLDKVEGRDEVVTASLGTRSTVAGIECENWTMTSAKDTVNVCVADRNAPAFALGSWLATHFKLDEAMKDGDFDKLFGGRKVMPIRMAAADGSFRMELTGSSTSAPEPTFFTMPAGFHVIDPGKLPFGGGS